MSQLYLFSRSDGGVTLYLHIEGELQRCIDEWERVHPGVTITEAVETTREQVPPIDEYRDAWRLDGKAIVHDMGKARELHRNKLRAERAPLLAALDVDSMKAIEGKDDSTLAAVALRKQALRDAPADPRIDRAQTIEELRAVELPQGTSQQR